MTTFASCLTSSRTIALPMPLLPPVTMATFPSSLIVALPFLRRLRTSRLRSILRCLLPRGASDLFKHFRDQSGPAGLVARAAPRAVVAMKILMEQQTVAPVRIGLHHGVI